MTIVRIWRSVTLARKAEQYLEYLNRIVIPAYLTAEGNKGLFILKELQGELAHFLLLSFWTSDKEFESSVGADTCEVVNPSPEEKSLLIAFESIARHYDVVYMSESPLLDKNML